MVITESIQKAIQAAIVKCGSSLSFARSIGVSHTTVSFWLKGRTRKINSTVWQNLLPQIREFLGPEASMTYPCGPGTGMPAGRVLHENSLAWYGAGTVPRMSAPLLQLSDLADFDPQIDPVEEIIRKRSTCSVMFTSPVRPGYFAVEIDGKHCDFFPEGTRLLLRWQDAPGDGDTVLVKLRNRKGFLFAAFARKGNEVVLDPLRKGGRQRVVSRDGLHKVCSWIVPIREAVQLF